MKPSCEGSETSRVAPQYQRKEVLLTFLLPHLSPQKIHPSSRGLLPTPPAAFLPFHGGGNVADETLKDLSQDQLNELMSGKMDFRGNEGQRDEEDGRKCYLCVEQLSWAATNWLIQLVLGK